MYKFKTKVAIVSEDLETMVQAGFLEWYLDFNVNLDGLDNFQISIPKQAIEYQHEAGLTPVSGGEALCINKLHKEYVGVNNFGTLTIKPKMLILKKDNSITVRF